MVDEYKVSPKLLTDSRPTWVTGVEHFEADIDQQVDAVLQGVAELASHPVCFGNQAAGSSLKKYLAEGWGSLEGEGYWSNAATSLIRFRPMMINMGPFNRWLRIKIVGEYHAAATISTGVTINSEYLGAYNLCLEAICLPLERLPEDLHLDLQLDHGAAEDPGCPAFRIDALHARFMEVL